MRIITFDEARGRTYEDTYSGWLEIFREVAESQNSTIDVIKTPSSWFPLLWYLGAWDEAQPFRNGWKREEVECSCAAEPILVDALWRADMRWSGDRRHTWSKEFKISTYSGFWRPEVLRYLDKLHRFNPDKKKCVLVPCAAEKPYPSPLHRAVKRIVTDDYHVIVVTSVLGLVPEELWHVMPHYDAGLPYFERVREEVFRYFSQHDYDKIVNYTDMLQSDIENALEKTGYASDVPILCDRRCDYQPLMTPAWLEKLKEACL